MGFFGTSSFGNSTMAICVERGRDALVGRQPYSPRLRGGMLLDRHSHGCWPRPHRQKGVDCVLEDLVLHATSLAAERQGRSTVASPGRTSSTSLNQHLGCDRPLELAVPRLPRDMAERQLLDD